MKMYWLPRTYTDILMGFDGKKRFGVAAFAFVSMASLAFKNDQLSPKETKKKIRELFESLDDNVIYEFNKLYKSTVPWQRTFYVICSKSRTNSDLIQTVHDHYKYAVKARPKIRTKNLYLKINYWDVATVMVNTRNIRAKLHTFYPENLSNNSVRKGKALVNKLKKLSEDELEELLLHTRGILTTNILQKILKKYDVENLEDVMSDLTRGYRSCLKVKLI